MWHLERTRTLSNLQYSPSPPRRLGDVCISPFSVNWTCKKSTWDMQASGRGVWGDMGDGSVGGYDLGGGGKGGSASLLFTPSFESYSDPLVGLIWSSCGMFV